MWALSALLLALGAAAYHFKWFSALDHSIPSAGEQQTLEAKNPMMELLSPDETGIDFANEIVPTEQNNVVNNINFYNGGGVCAADFNNDGLTDLYFVSGSGKNKLYMNQGNFKFKENAEAAGVASPDGFESGATIADVNADGFMDIFVNRAGPKDYPGRGCQLFVNNPDKPGYFTEMAEAFGLKDDSPVTGAAFFDYDLDGDLDCYILNHSEDLTFPNKINLRKLEDGTLRTDLTPKEKYDSDRFYRNDGPGPLSANGIKTCRFKEVSKEVGIQNMGFGLSVSIGDMNNDGFPDVYVANDFVQPDNFYYNNGKGQFTDKLDAALRHNSVFSMGVDLSDFDNDALLDVFSLDMLPSDNTRQKISQTTNSLSRYTSIVQYGQIEPVTRNTLQRNNGNGTFSDVACLAGVYKTDWAWNCLICDLDNDGVKDMYISNGYPKDVNSRDYKDFILPEATKTTPLNQMNFAQMKDLISKMPNYKTRNFFYRNAGNWQFEDMNGQWATVAPSWSCGAVWCDLDNDGDLELVVNNLEEPAFVYKNLAREKNATHYVQITPKGAASNPFAFGTSVLIENNGVKQFQELYPNRGIFSASEPMFHFGLGNASAIERLTIRWPDGKTQTLINVAADQQLTLQYADASGYVASLAPPVREDKWFKDVSNQVNAPFLHRESGFIDFERWEMHPWTISDLGPLVTIGDVNTDGLDDFFIGNGFDSPSAIYVQNQNGTFRPTSMKLMDTYKNFEDDGAVFFDADGDGDQDLFVTSGGPDATSDLAWQPRLYVNDGKGEFSNETSTRLPEIRCLAQRAAAFDMDKDGDQDIVMGGRIMPNQWPLTPKSFVLRNDKGKFTDISDQAGGDFTYCGMVTDLAWSDLNGDGQSELVVTGEWMPVSVFAWEGNALRNVTERYGLSGTEGIWQRLCLADVDGDGDTDMVTGNIGLNTRHRAPFHCYASDFDKNGTLDPIVAIDVDGRQYPLMQREVLMKQMPALKKKFLYSKDYGSAQMKDLWGAEALEQSKHFVCNEIQSCWWENQQGKFVKHVLPMQAQASVVQGIIVYDFNADGQSDILLSGNKYGFDVETNSCDAGNGVFLLGRGQGKFDWTDNLATGFWASLEARDMGLIKRGGKKPLVIVSNNNTITQFFEVK